MNAWTTAAKDELNRFLTNIRRPLEQAGADAAEVIEDIKRHIDEEVAAARLRVVTVHELQPMLTRIGEPWRRESEVGDKASAGIILQALKSHSASASGIEEEGGGATVVASEPIRATAPPPPPTEPPVAPKPKGPPIAKSAAQIFRPRWYHLFCGVFIPLATLVIEWTTGFCATNIFNPIPTWGHILLVALVPLVNALSWFAMFKGREERFAKQLTFGLGLALGVSIVYSIVFIPLLLPGIIALVVFGLGLLPLSPYFGFSTTLSMRSMLKRRLNQRSEGKLRFWPGIVVAFAAFVLLDISFVGTKALLGMAVSPNTEKTGLRLLKVFAHEDTILRACYNNGRSSQFAPALFWLIDRQQVNPEQARRIYFQLYGRAFNAVPTPGPRAAGLPAWQFEPQFDPERGGDKVGSPVPHLSLASSRIDATVEPNAALSYLEWIVEFNNGGTSDAEARCEVVLPPGAVVSRLTLWINGEEREAAFAGKAQVREAYQNVVVVQRRDPVLVTSSGKDRILMQAFPVQPSSRMKMRVGMTVPLILDAQKNGVLRWPYIRERNFALAEELEHSFWIDSPMPVETLSIPLKTGRSASGHYMARGTLRERDNSTIHPAVLIRRNPVVDTTWARDTRANDGSIIVQNIREREIPAIKDIVLVVDSSVSMESIASDLAKVPLPLTRPIHVVIAGNPLRIFRAENSALLVRELEKVRFAGGQDNVPALERAWDLAAESGSGAIVWLHGPQPVAISSSESLKQRFERRRNAVQLFDLSIERAPNVIAENLPSSARYELVSMHRPPLQTLTALLGELSGSSRRFETVREKADATPPGAESNLHLARVWAFDEINRLVESGDRNKAVELAGLYQLVTEVSGAVVLETAEQFKRAGLHPVSPGSVPVVPEPSTWALLLLGGIALIYFRRRQQRARAQRIVQT